MLVHDLLRFLVRSSLEVLHIHSSLLDIECRGWSFGNSNITAQFRRSSIERRVRCAAVVARAGCTWDRTRAKLTTLVCKEHALVIAASSNQIGHLKAVLTGRLRKVNGELILAKLLVYFCCYGLATERQPTFQLPSYQNWTKAATSAVYADAFTYPQRRSEARQPPVRQVSTIWRA